jgi:hypothetical protein
MRMVPRGVTGYPGIGLVVASAPSVRPTAAKVADILNQFDTMEVDHGLLGTRPGPPDITFAIVTDHGALSADMRPRARFPAVVLTYRNVPCESYVPPR